MTLAACLEHRPIHIFGRGYRCAVCDIEFLVPDNMMLRGEAGAAGLPIPVKGGFLIDADAPISPETQKALDAIDENIRAAHKMCSSTYFD